MTTILMHLKPARLIFSFISLAFFSITNVIAQENPRSVKTTPLKVMLSGTPWKLRAGNDVPQDGAVLSTAGFNDANWQDAIVPGTAFNSYIPHGIKPGIEKDPDYADNIYQVDKSKYNRDFWWRTEFTCPASFKNKTVWLNFEGINKEGDIYFNGKNLGTIRGLMQRGTFKVTLQKGKNALAVLVHMPIVSEKHGLANYGTPTYVSSNGWDWMPPVPGMNTGITDDVYLTASGDITIHDPWIRTALPGLPSTATAAITVSTVLHNSAAIPVAGTLSGIIIPGNITFAIPVTIAANTDTVINFAGTSYPQLTVQNPRLWWPNGYGDQSMYTCQLQFTTGKQVSDIASKNFGIKQYTYDTVGGPLHVWINGERIYLKGGNWGMSDYLLRCRGSEYDTKIRFHKEMNFNMIRNWTGETTDEEFYDACDKYGIMVWDDFWLNNLGPIDSLAQFERNAIEKVKRLRDHPCIAIWCGANEGLPGGDSSSALNKVIKNSVAVYDGNDRHYQARSNAGTTSQWLTGDSHNLSGSGLWTHEEPKTYFIDPHNGYPWSKHSYSIRSELGTAVFPNVESFKKFIPPADLWPRNTMWDKHFFSNDGAYGGGASPTKYMEDIDKRYGKATGIDDFCKKAQLMNVETNKAMFEGWQEHMWDDASGLLIWMSQSSYPSMIWQTYDFYYDLTGAYFGARQACEPVHIQWNPASDSISIVNNTLQTLRGLKAEAAIYNKNGAAVPGLTQSVSVNSVSKTSVQRCIELHIDTTKLTDVYFIKLLLKNEQGIVLSENFYWNGKSYLDYSGLNTMPSSSAYLSVSKPVTTKLSNGNIQLTYTISNANYAPTAAFGIRVQLMNKAGTEQILPVITDDSYFSLMKGEVKTIHIELDPGAAKENSYQLKVTPYN